MTTPARETKREARKGYLRERGGAFLVGAEEKPDYSGPCAEISYDETWLHISTDDYEGHAMLNIEALPYLRRALAKISKAIKSRSAT